MEKRQRKNGTTIRSDYKEDVDGVVANNPIFMSICAPGRRIVRGSKR